MNVLDFYIRLYNSLQTPRWLPTWTMTPFRRFVRLLANKHIPKYLAGPITFVPKSADRRIVVSFTSFPARINNVWQVVECMLKQTLTPSKIILWLSKEDFPQKRDLPESLLERENNIFEIRMVEGNIRSHKKYYYASLEYANDLLFLIDDDIYYPTHIIERSLAEYEKHPQSVICNYGCQIAFDNTGKHLSYNMWGPIQKEGSVFFGSGGGTLFKPSELYKDLSNKELALSLTPTADDVWLNTMARLCKIPVYAVSNPILLPILNMNNINLTAVNNGMNQNDVQIAAVEEYYGRCFDK